MNILECVHHVEMLLGGRLPPRKQMQVLARWRAGESPEDIAVELARMDGNDRGVGVERRSGEARRHQAMH